MTLEKLKGILGNYIYDMEESHNICMNSHENAIEYRHEVGGYQGGDCWGSEAVPYRNSEEPRSKEAAFIWLEEIFPDITLSNYVKLIECVSSRNDSQGGYYGNYEEYIVYSLKIEDIYKFAYLKSNKMIVKTP